MENKDFYKPLIQLDVKMRTAIESYIKDKGYSIWTTRKYRAGIDKLFKKFNHLDIKRCKQIMNQPNPNQKALLNLILVSASESGIEIPNIKVTGRIAKPREIPKIIYTIEDIRNMINLIPKNRDKLFFRCVYSIGAGLRVSEVINMKWNDFNWGRWINNQEDQGQFIIRNTKRGKTFAVPVPPEIMKSLFEHAQQTRVNIEMKHLGEGVGFKKIPISKKNVFIFETREFDKTGFLKNVEPEEYSHLYTQQVYNYVQHNVMKRYLFDYLGHRLKIHSLRHTRATQLINEGVSISIVSKLLGHKSLSTTMIYLDMSTVEQAKAIKGIPTL